MRKILFLILLISSFQSIYCQISVYDRNAAIDLIKESTEDINNAHYAPAIEKLEQAIQLDSSIRQAYVLINQAARSSGNSEMQKVYLNKAIKLYTEDDLFYYYLGKYYMKENQLDTSIYYLSRAVKFSKQNGEDFPAVYDYYASRGICYLKQQHYEKANSDFDAALKLNKLKAGIYVNKGIALFKLNRNTEACLSWNKAKEKGMGNIVQRYIDKYCE